MAHQLVWFDIPAVDLERATRFYEAILGVQIARESFQNMKMSILPHGQGDVAGCIYEGGQPADHGLLVYLNVQGRLDDAVSKVESHGGKILEPKHQIGPHGYRAVILDSEGNRLALHSM